MAQPSVSAFFISRKRGIEDEIISNKKKVICLDRASNSSESLDTHQDSDELSSVIVFPKTQGYISNDEEPKKVVKKPTVRQGITPQRTTRSRKIHMQEIDGIQAPKVVNFFKGGNLSPQKKPRGVTEAVTSNPEASIIMGSSSQAGMLTPVKKVAPAPQENVSTSIDAIEKTSLLASNGMKLDEIKKKLKGSAKLAALKTSLNKLYSGFDRLDQMEKNRLASEPLKPKPAEVTADAPKGLKPFKSIELEILSPSKRLTSPMRLKDSPMKNSLIGSPKIMSPRRLFSPTKAGQLQTSPVKAPAFQRFQNLAQSGVPTLQLPFKYRYLLEIFTAVDSVCAIFYNRKEKITFKKLKPAVQRYLRKNFYESHLSQIQKLMPEAYSFDQEKTRNFGSTSKMDYYQLVIVPNIGEAGDNVKELTLSSQLLVERSKKMTKILTDLVFDEHDKFLQTLEVPMSVTRGALKRWHPDFDLESVCDVEQGDLPLPPNVEKFSKAKDILCTARNLFNCSTATERALERFEEKKKEEKPKQIQNLEQQAAKSTSTPARGSDNANDERKKVDVADGISSVLKGVPKSLLEKIRAKQAAKALDTMTRRPSQEREAAKYARLPEIARHARNVYVTEKKGVLPLDLVLKKIENSYKGTVTLKEVDELLRLITKVIPDWLSFHEIRKSMWIKLARDSDFTLVTEKLEKISAEKAKIQ